MALDKCGHFSNILLIHEHCIPSIYRFNAITIKIPMVFLKLSFFFEVYLSYNVVFVFAVPNGIFFLKQKQKETILNFILNGKKKNPITQSNPQEEQQKAGGITHS